MNKHDALLEKIDLMPSGEWISVDIDVGGTVEILIDELQSLASDFRKMLEMLEVDAKSRIQIIQAL